MHRIIGALSATHRGGIYAGLDRFAGTKQENYGLDIETESFLESVAKCRLVFLGEIHSVPQIVALQAAVMTKMASLPGKLHVVFEHFSFEMQEILEEYQCNKISFEEMVDLYQQIGTEGHNLLPYKPLLEHAKERETSVKLHAGFLPRTYARQLMKESESAALKAAAQWLQPNTTSLEGTEFHYNLFESMLSGRNLHDGNPPVDQFQRIFKAQLLKDIAMAHKISSLIRESDDEEERFLVIAGNGHLSYYQGVPERVLAEHPHLIDTCCLVTSHEWDRGLIGGSSPEHLLDALEAGPPGANPADYLYVYQEGEDHDAVKAETRQAYDKVGETAHLEGNLQRARAIMTYLGYTEEEIGVAGGDAFNYQGVGNPLRHAKIQPGERVLDVGSGLGIDSLLAAYHAGPDGKVIGIDISQREVDHAQARAHARGLDVRFAVADMDEIPLPDNCLDVVISNGAFCLAPNKEKAFAELYRVLKPGGRIAVCTTTIQSEKLDKAIDWPLCMRMFVSKNDLEPLCKRLGYVNVVVDDSDSKMTYELPEELQGLNPERNRVHMGGQEFEHLKDYDMDELCARVCVVARKPQEQEAQQEKHLDA
jgi:arsenite methyltransferase